MRQLQQEASAIKEEVATKESRSEFERILQETEILKSKDNHLESELKLVNHKLDKMELLSQKAERQQAKKDIELIKEIEERVRKEIRTSSSGLNNSSNGMNSLSSTTPGIKRESANKSQRPSIVASKLTEGGLPSIQESQRGGVPQVSLDGGDGEVRETEVNGRGRNSMMIPRMSSMGDENGMGSNWSEQIEVLLGRWGDRLKNLEQFMKETG